MDVNLRITRWSAIVPMGLSCALALHGCFSISLGTPFPFASELPLRPGSTKEPEVVEALHAIHGLKKYGPKESKQAGDVFRVVYFGFVGFRQKPPYGGADITARGRVLAIEYVDTSTAAGGVLNSFVFFPVPVENGVRGSGSISVDFDRVQPGIFVEDIVRELGPPIGEGRCPSSLFRCSLYSEYVWAWVWLREKVPTMLVTAIENGRVATCWLIGSSKDEVRALGNGECEAVLIPPSDIELPAVP